MGIIKTRNEIAKLLDRNKKIGFTSGSFDILHAGHVSYLEKAKAKCDVLVVGVNSDISVKKYKGEDRPIVPEQDRIKIISSLVSVDYVFLFDERRNKTNIETIKPNFYIKAGDYQKEELTSAVYLKPFGGEVILIPPEQGLSSSSIINKIQKLPISENSNIKAGPAVFLDRDGVINKDDHFVHTPDKFELLPNVLVGLKKLQDMHYKLIIVTNQGGIGMGYYTEVDFFNVSTKMLILFSAHGINIDKIYFCPHSKSENCECRKPNAGMLMRGQRQMNVDMSKSFMIGDKETDIQAGNAAGVKTMLIGKENKCVHLFTNRADANYVVKDLLSAAEIIQHSEDEIVTQQTFPGSIPIDPPF